MRKESSQKFGAHPIFAVSIELIFTPKNQTILAIECGNGMEYNGCGSGESRACGSAQDENDLDPDFCVEGCYCPTGTSLSNGMCIPDASCPCMYNGKEFQSDSEIK